MKIKLDSLEQQIENVANSYRLLPKRKMRKVESIITRIRKNRTVNIRLAENILTELKRRSQREGLPYQTLISSILYKYVTDRLIDEDAIRKSLNLLRK